MMSEMQSDEQPDDDKWVRTESAEFTMLPGGARKTAGYIIPAYSVTQLNNIVLRVPRIGGVALPDIHMPVRNGSNVAWKIVNPSLGNETAVFRVQAVNVTEEKVGPLRDVEEYSPDDMGWPLYFANWPETDRPANYSIIVEYSTTQQPDLAKSLFKETELVPGEGLRMTPTLTTIPDGGYNQIGVRKVDKGSYWFEYQLYWMSDGNPAAPVVLRNYEDSNIRVVLAGFTCIKWRNVSGYSAGYTSVEWGYNEAAHAWVLVNPDGTPAWLRGAQNGVNEVLMSGTVPIIVYSRRRPTLVVRSRTRVVIKPASRTRVEW